jgi:hypothetical protein
MLLSRTPRKRVLLVVLPLAITAAFVTLALRSTGATATPKPAAYVGTARTVSAAATTGVTTRSLGTVHGVLNLRPAGVTRHSTWAVFAIDGRRRLVRTTARAPFPLRVDTRNLPNGSFTITITVFATDRAPTFTVIRLVVRNVPVRPTMTPTARPTMPMATATATTQPTAAPVARPATATTTAPSTTSAPPAAPRRLSELPTVTSTVPQKF